MTTLENTIKGTSSEEYVERLIFEYQQLLIRYKRFSRFTDMLAKGEVTIELKVIDDTYFRQLAVMKQYLAILKERLLADGVCVDTLCD